MILATLFVVARPLPSPVILFAPFVFDWMHEFFCGNPTCDCLGPFGVRV